jgi:hypothetical protein
MIVGDIALDGADRDAWRIWSHEDGMTSLCPLPSTNLFQHHAGIAPGQIAELRLATMQAILEQHSEAAARTFGCMRMR